MTRPRVLIVGGDSAIGQALGRRLIAAGVAVTATTRRSDRGGLMLDLADNPANWPPLSGFDAAALCAGETSIARCAAAPGPTRLVNVDNMAALGRRLREQGTRLLFLSTSMVFDGRRPFPRADDPVCPVTDYGRQKADTEQSLLGLGGGVAVLRITKVLIPSLPLFRNWAAALTTGQPVQAFTDLRMAPVRADLTADTLTRMLIDPEDGVFQLSAARDIDYLTAARELARRLAAAPELATAALAAAAGVPEAARPRHAALDPTKLTARYGVGGEPPETALAALAAALACETA